MCLRHPESIYVPPGTSSLKAKGQVFLQMLLGLGADSINRVMGLWNSVDAVQRMLDEPAGCASKLTPLVMSLFYDIALVGDAVLQISTYFPWVPGFPEPFARLDFGIHQDTIAATRKIMADKSMLSLASFVTPLNRKFLTIPMARLIQPVRSKT